MPPFLEDAYRHAETFCRLLAQRANAGFFRTLLLRRVGSTMEAGRKTVEKMLSEWTTLDDEEDDEETLSQLRTLMPQERAVLERFLKALEANQERDPKYQIVRKLLLDHGWREWGCIIFSQYFTPYLAGGTTHRGDARRRDRHLRRGAGRDHAPGCLHPDGAGRA